MLCGMILVNYMLLTFYNRSNDYVNHLNFPNQCL